MSESLSDLLEAFGAAQSENVHTSLPGVVTAVKGNRVNVQPSLNRALRDGRTESLPVVPNVPIWFPRGGGAAITWPVKAGDGCMLVFAERSLDEWKSGGGTVTPDDPRRHGLSDAVALVGLDSAASGSDDVEISMDGSKITVSPDAVTITVGGVTVTVSGDGLEVTGGDITHNGTSVGDAHVHSGVVSGASNTGNPV